MLITTWLDRGFDKEELRIRVLGFGCKKFGGKNGVVEDVFREEI